MKIGMRVLVVLVLATVMIGASVSVAFSANMAPVNLGLTSTYGLFVRGYGLASSPGTSTCNGDLGWEYHSYSSSSPGMGAQRIAPEGIVVNGTENVANSAATTVAVDLDKAYDDAWSRPTGKALFGETSGTLLPGVYEDGDVKNTFDIPGTLTLDGQGDPESVFIFRTHSGLVTGRNSRIVLINGARFCRVFWVVGSADLGPNSTFVGHIISEGGITVGTGAFVNGQLLSGAGAENDQGFIQLDGVTITNGPCTPRLPRTGYPPAPVRADLPIALFAIVAMGAVLLTVKRRAFDF